MVFERRRSLFFTQKQCQSEADRGGHQYKYLYNSVLP